MIICTGPALYYAYMQNTLRLLSRHAVARLPLSVVVGTLNSIEIQVDRHFWSNDPKYHDTIWEFLSNSYFEYPSLKLILADFWHANWRRTSETFPAVILSIKSLCWMTKVCEFCANTGLHSSAVCYNFSVLVTPASTSINTWKPVLIISRLMRRCGSKSHF